MCCGNSSNRWNGGCGCGCGGSRGMRCGCGWTGGQRRCGCSWPAPLWSAFDSAAVTADTASVSACGCDSAAVATDTVWPAVDFPSFVSGGGCGCGCNG